MKIQNNLELMGLAFLSVLAPIQHLIFATVFFVLADFVTGIWKAKKIGETITSQKMKNTIPKLLLYVLALIVGQVAQQFVLPEIPFVKIFSGFIALVEIKSILENINGITGLDLWKELKSYLSRKK